MTTALPTFAARPEGPFFGAVILVLLIIVLIIRELASGARDASGRNLSSLLSIWLIPLLGALATLVARRF